METQEMIDLALNARLGYWPPHLGLKTDAEKIEYLATRLDEAATQIVNNEALQDENEALLEENDSLKSDVERLNDTVKDIRSLTDRHVQNVQD